MVTVGLRVLGPHLRIGAEVVFDVANQLVHLRRRLVFRVKGLDFRV